MTNPTIDWSKLEKSAKSVKHAADAVVDASQAAAKAVGRPKSVAATIRLAGCAASIVSDAASALMTVSDVRHDFEGDVHDARGELSRCDDVVRTAQAALESAAAAYPPDPTHVATTQAALSDAKKTTASAEAHLAAIEASHNAIHGRLLVHARSVVQATTSVTAEVGRALEIVSERRDLNKLELKAKALDTVTRKLQALEAIATPLLELISVSTRLRSLLSVAALSGSVCEWFPIDPEMSLIRNTAVVPKAIIPKKTDPEPEDDPTDDRITNHLKRLLAHLTK